MINYILIFLLQFFFSIAKTLEIKYTYENKLILLLWNSVVINLIWISSMYISLKSLYDGNWIVIVIFLLGGVLGKWFSIKHFENYRSAIFRFIKKKN